MVREGGEGGKGGKGGKGEEQQEKEKEKWRLGGTSAAMILNHDSLISAMASEPSLLLCHINLPISSREADCGQNPMIQGTTLTASLMGDTFQPWYQTFLF